MCLIPSRLLSVLSKLQEAGSRPTPTAAGEYRARCPVHADSSPSLGVRLSDAHILVHCAAGCDPRAVTDALGLEWSDLFIPADDPEVEWEGGGAAHPTAVAAAQTPGRAAPPAPGGLAVEVYAAVLAALPMSPDHRAALRARGLTDDQIDCGQYRTAEPAAVAAAVDRLLEAHTKEDLLGVPGFEEKNGRVVLALAAGLVVPVRNPAGDVVALKVRRDGDAPGAKYLLASTPTAPASAAAHVPVGVTGPLERVRLTEGELKADVATARSGVPTIGVPGVSQWPLAVPVLRALAVRTVMVAMDQDGKSGTKAATEKALLGLTEAGFTVLYECWDGTSGKGVDDVLAAGGTTEVLQGLAGVVRLRKELNGPAAAAADSEPATPFPLDVFPPALADFATQVAAATNTPPDFCGAAMLVAAGVAVGNAAELELKPGAWAERANLQLGLVADPGAGKTPALGKVLVPLRARERRGLAAHRAAVLAYDQAVAAHAAAADPAVPPPDPPGPPERCLIGDATVEATVLVLQANPRGVLKHVDEGSGLRAEHGAYKAGRGTDRQFYLQSWSGERATVDRKAQDGVPLVVEAPFLPILFGVQPAMLSDLGDPRGRSDGDLDRKLWVYPDRRPPARWSRAGVTPAAEAGWAGALDRLFAIPLRFDADGAPAPAKVGFTPDGETAWAAWFDALADELADPALPAVLIGPWVKMRSHAARLALIVHLLWTGGDPGEGVGAEAVARAARLADYFQAHARRVYARLRQAPENGRMHAVLDWVRKRGGRCTAREVLRASLATDADAAKKLLRELAERGYGRLESDPAENGKKVERFHYEPT